MKTIKKKQRYITDRVACIILAGGKGTRLFPLTKNRCKPAVVFGGQYRLIDIPISNALNAQLRNIFVISQYFSSSINNHIKETYHVDPYHGIHLELLSPEETLDDRVWFEGTADAVRKNLDYFLKSPIDYFLILSGDQLYNMDFQAMLQFAREKDADLTIAALPVPQEDATRMGVMEIDDRYNIEDFIEKPKDPKLLEKFALNDVGKKKHKIKNIEGPAYLASMGIYVFKKDVLISLLKEDTREDFGKHLIPTQLKKGKTAAFLYQGYWEDIGTVASYYQANLSLVSNQLGLDLYDESAPIYSYHPALPSPRLVNTRIHESIICHGAVIEGKEIVHSVIGQRAVIGKDTVIRKSIILGNQFYQSPLEQKVTHPEKFAIGSGCLIENAIIDENVSIGKNVKITNKAHLSHYDGDGIFVRDGIVIVTSGTHLPDGFTF